MSSPNKYWRGVVVVVVVVVGGGWWCFFAEYFNDTLLVIVCSYNKEFLFLHSLVIMRQKNHDGSDDYQTLRPWAKLVVYDKSKCHFSSQDQFHADPLLSRQQMSATGALWCPMWSVSSAHPCHRCRDCGRLADIDSLGTICIHTLSPMPSGYKGQLCARGSS